MMHTLEQERAKHALARVREVEKTLSPEQQASYCSYVKELPTLIVMSGLGQAVATLLERSTRKATDSKAYQRLSTHLASWLCRPGEPYAEHKTLIDAIVTCDQATYVRAHADALAYLVWLKKFAQAFLARPELGDHDG